MRISRIILPKFKRFTHLEIKDIPETARLVVLAGPNGSGKSSLFDAINLRSQIDSGVGWSNDATYYSKEQSGDKDSFRQVAVEFYGNRRFEKGGFYCRSAYRNEPEFKLDQLSRVGAVIDNIRTRRMIDQDTSVSQNYQRLASQAMESMFRDEKESTTVGEFREKTIGVIRDAIKKLFPDLILNSLGSPIEEGTFKFDKGTSKQFEYKNLSGGEKAAFDLILDILVKRSAMADAIYCIDEPEAHMNTRLQRDLLGVLYDLVPEKSQLWVATHSIGMMRKAKELYEKYPGKVVFLNFDQINFDQSVVLTPTKPDRAFWESVLSVALDDLASLVAPEQVVVCEGNPSGPVAGKNEEHDARCYDAIFRDEFPDVKFVAGGNAKDIAGDRLGLLAALPKVAQGMKVRRLIDRDDHSAGDVAAFVAAGITVLGKRNIESYLYDDEVISALCIKYGQPAKAASLITEKVNATQASVKRGNAVDDIKSAAGDIYVKAKQLLGLSQVGNDQKAFARETLAPLIKPGMKVYEDLKHDVFR